MKKNVPRSLCSITAHVRAGRVGERVSFDPRRGSARGREPTRGACLPHARPPIPPPDANPPRPVRLPHRGGLSQIVSRDGAS